MPVNPDIAHIIFLRGFMEKIGRGILKILDTCKEAGLAEPLWRTNKNDAKLTFFSNTESHRATVHDTNKKSEGATKSLKLVILLKAIAENEGKRIPDHEEITKINKRPLNVILTNY